jgi:hypothetical protein
MLIKNSENLRKLTELSVRCSVRSVLKTHHRRRFFLVASDLQPELNRLKLRSSMTLGCGDGMVESC